MSQMGRRCVTHLAPDILINIRVQENIQSAKSAVMFSLEATI